MKNLNKQQKRLYEQEKMTEGERRANRGLLWQFYKDMRGFGGTGDEILDDLVKEAKVLAQKIEERMRCDEFQKKFY